METTLGTGVWTQLDKSDYKWVIGDENGDPIGVSEKEAIKWLWDNTPEGIRRRGLYYSKSIARGCELMKEVLKDYEWGKVAQKTGEKLEIKTGRGLGK